jgi:hypothetical protein
VIFDRLQGSQPRRRSRQVRGLKTTHDERKDVASFRLRRVELCAEHVCPLTPLVQGAGGEDGHYVEGVLDGLEESRMPLPAP